MVQGTDQQIIITTCHKDTNIDRVIATYEDSDCSNPACQASIIHSDGDFHWAANNTDDNCKLLPSGGASTVVWDSVAGKKYKLTMLDKAGEMGGMFAMKATSLAQSPMWPLILVLVAAWEMLSAYSISGVH